MKSSKPTCDIYEPLIVKGKFGFIYEFKLDANSRSVKFIYYREGEREFHGMTFWIHLGLIRYDAVTEEKFEQASRMIKDTMRGFPSAGVSVVNALIKKYA